MIPFMILDVAAQSSDVDLSSELIYLKPYPEGSTSISTTSGYQLQAWWKNTGSGNISNAEFNLKIVDSDGGIRKDSTIPNAVFGPNSRNLIGWQEMLDSNAPLGTWRYTITVDPGNKIAETDETNNVVTGTFVVVTATIPNSSRGAVTTPITIDVGGKAVYINADYNGNFVVGLESGVIKKYNVNNNAVLSFSDNFLNGVGFDSSNNIIVANGDYKIKKYDSNGNYIKDIAQLPSRPFRMEVDSKDNVFVTSDAGNYVEKVYKITPSGSVSTVYTESNNPDLTGIGIDSSANFYVGQNFKDGQGNKCCKIMKYSSSGSLITSMGGWWGNNPPAAAGFTNQIMDIAIDPLTGNVYGSDDINNRISIFTPSGTFVKQIGSVGVLLNDPYGVDFDSFGNLYVSQRTDTNQVMIFPPNYSDPKSNDSTPPTITQIKNIERYTGYAAGATVSWYLESHDNELVVSQECTHKSGSTFPVGTTTVTCTATDNVGNKSLMSFDITQIFSEITSNSIKSNKNSYIFGESKVILTGTVLNMDSGVVWVESYAPNGNGGGGQVQVYGGHFTTEIFLSNDSNQYTVKLKTVGNCHPNCTVLDTISFAVSSPTPVTPTPVTPTLVVDNSVITTGSNGFTIQYNNTHFKVIEFENNHLYGWSLTFNGNPSGTGTLLFDQTNTNKWYTHRTNEKTGDLIQTWYYDTGRSIPLASVSYTVKPVTVTDTIPPVITTDSNISISTTNSTGARVTYSTPLATDNVSVTIKPTCTPSSGSLFPVGVNSVICTASDAAGNIGTKSFTITVINTNVVGDNIPPTFTKMQDISLVATTSNGATVTYDLPKVTDNIKVTSGPICTPASGSFFPIGQTIVTCTASDAAKNQGSTTFTVTVSSLIAVPVEIPSSVSVSTGKLYYSSTEAVFVTGIATPQTDNEVSITVRDSLDNLVLSEYLPVKISGVYTGIIFPNSLWNTNGTYLMSANYGTSTTNTAFEFEFVPTEINNSNIPTGITLSLDSTQRILGDKLEITSTLTGGASGQSILIDVTNPLGNSVLLQSLNTNEVGSVTLSVNIQDDWISGVYTITASDTSPLLDYSTSKSLQIVAPLPEIIISPTLSTTESGQTITSYDAGDIGYFSTSLLSESTSNVLVTVNVVDSEDTTLGVAFFKSIIGKGDSKIVLGFKIPEDAADGEAKIYVNTYTNWIDQGGIPISSELISTVNIKGIVVKVVEESIIDESYDAIISPANGSGTPGCEKNQEGCFIPNQTTVNLGDVVLFSNTDIVSHTFAAGSASDGPTGEFDSGLVISGDSYKWTANVAGEIDYFCMIHPWMTGILIVQDNSVKPIILPENIIPTLSVVSNLVLSASNSTGTIVNYDTPTATGGEITTGVTCTPPSGSLFPIGSTQVTCIATNTVGNTGMTSFMVTINPVPKVSDQTLSVKVGKVSYNNLEPIFVTGSIGKITGQPIILEVYDEANNLISIKQVTPKESKTYTTVLTSNELWNSSGQYNIIATYGTVTAQNTFDFEVMGIQEVISEKIPKSLFVDTDKSTYVLGDDVLIEMQLVDGGSGQSILLEVRDSQNYPVLLQSLNTDNNGTANILYQSDSAHHSGIYSIITKSQTSDWEFTSTKTFVTVPQIPDITIGNTVSTLSDGNKVEYFGTGTMGYFHTPVVSKSVSDVLITVNIFDVQNTPLGLAYFDSKVVDDTFDIVLGLQIPQDAAPGLATVYINTYTEWPNEGGVPILAERVSFIEIKPSNQSNLILSNNSTSNNSTSTNSTEK